MGFLDFLFPGKKCAPESNVVPFSPESLARLMREGRKIEAIKQVRLYSGVGLKEAKDFIDCFGGEGLSWEKTASRYPSIAVALAKTGTPNPLPPGGHNRAPGFAPTPWERLAPHLQNSFTTGDRQQFDALLKAGHIIAAIKLVREKTGMGLKEAKDFVESFKGTSSSLS